MRVCSRIRQYHPASRDEQRVAAESETPRRGRGRPKGSRSTARSVHVRHEQVLGVRYADHSGIPAGLWDLLASLVCWLFRKLVKIAEQLHVEGPGHEQERLLFVDLPRVFFRVVREIATWWWSYDRGYAGTTVQCPQCHGQLKYRGDTGKTIVSRFGPLRPRRAYYRCSNKACRYSVCPLDERLGVGKDHFLPSVQEVVVWLTSLDPYGKSLEFVARLLEFSISHRTAWLITQKVGNIVKQRQDDAIGQAFDNPASPLFPAAEVPPPDVGVVELDGTCGRIGYDDDSYVLLLIHRLGLDQAKTLLVIGDGAKWIWCGAREHLSSLGVTLVEILDYWHAVEHVWKVANSLYGQGTAQAVAWAKARQADLLESRLCEFFHSLDAALRTAQQVSDSLATMIGKEIAYFRNNENRIDYARYLKSGYLIGSGAMEGSCKHHIKERIDRAGMRWSPLGAMAILRNRTLIKNGEWDDFWRDEAQRRWQAYRRLTASMAV